MGTSDRFAGKVVVVTGAAGGIGRVTAARFAAEGASVVAVDLPGDGVDETVRQIGAAGGTALSVPADVTDEAQVADYVAAAVQAYGGIDVLFNNAGIEGVVTPMSSYPVEMFDKVLAVNVRGVFLGLKHAGPAIAARGGGSIVNTSSVAGLGGSIGVSAYTASKHAVIGLTRTGALELASANVRVNAVCPSPIETRMMRSLESGMGAADPQAVHDMIAARIPLGRYGESTDVAALVTFLASDEAAFLTGGFYVVDGGMKAN